MRASTLVKLLLGALLLFCQLPAQANAQKEKGQKLEANKIVDRYPLIWVDADVISRSTGLAVTDLRHEEVIISENNVQQVIAAWQHLPVPLSFLILVDAAANYTDNVSLGNRVNALKSSLASFLKADDEVSVMALTGDALLLQDYTSDKDLIGKALDRASRYKEMSDLSAETRFRIAVQQAAKQVGRTHSPEARSATILISDLPERTAREVVLPEWVVRSVLDSASLFCWSRSSNLPSNFSDPAEASFNAFSITGLVGLSGGEFVGSEWKSFLDRSRERYRIAYWPDTRGRSGDVVRIKLELKPSATRNVADLVLIYTRFAIIPFS